MTLAEFYPMIKTTHITLAVLSGTLFASRGLGVLAGAAWPTNRRMRTYSQWVDSALLLAAVLLLVALNLNPLTTPWLLTKLGLVLAYVVLGVFALRRASTRRGKGMAYAAALTCLLAIVAVARTHQPLAGMS